MVHRSWSPPKSMSGGMPSTGRGTTAAAAAAAADAAVSSQPGDRAPAEGPGSADADGGLSPSSMLLSGGGDSVQKMV